MHVELRTVKNKAFTLIELLTVIVIIAMLLAVIMPTLTRAKEQARSLYCKNNLKQMCYAASTYSVEADGYYPIAQYTTSATFALAGGGSGADTHISLIEPPDQQEGTVFYQYCWDFTRIVRGQSEQIIPGLLWRGETSLEVNHCPSYKGGDNWMGSPFSGYNYNTSYVGHGQGESVDRKCYTDPVLPHPTMPFTQIVMPARAVQVGNTAMCVLFGDSQYAGGANKFMRSPMAWAGDTNTSVRAGGTQGFRHNGSTNAGWADGHVSSQKECRTNTYSGIRKQLEEYNKTNRIKIGFLSEDNSAYDLR